MKIMENLIKENWTHESAGELDAVLAQHSTPQYRKFSEGIVNTKMTVLGVRMPVLRQIVKAIAKGDVASFLDNVPTDSLEKAMIHGLLITELKDENKAIKHFNKFLPFIDNWAVCDTVCLDFKLIGKDKEKHFQYVSELAQCESEFISRAGLILLLKFYREVRFFNRVFGLLDSINSDLYYVNMASAWLIAEYFLVDGERTKEYLKENKLNNFTHNKAIQKIRESFRVNAETKKELTALKRNKR